MNHLLMDPSLLNDKVEELPFAFDDYASEVSFREQLREWHEIFGSIYSVEINEVIFFFRTLSKNELDIAQELYDDDYNRTEYICKACVIEPEIEDYSLDIYAGIPEVLCREILSCSGFTDEKKVKAMIAQWEKHMTNVEHQLPLVIKEAFHDIPLDEIESWPMSKMCEYYVKAKWVLENFRGITLTNANETQ